MASISKVCVTGASGLLGAELVKHLSSNGYHVCAIGRSQCPSELVPHCRWFSHDLSSMASFELNVQAVVHCAPLWLLPDFLDHLMRHGKINRCIAFSSTSVISKAQAQDDQDRELAIKLLKAEEKITKICNQTVDFTLLRPTMIYGYAKDKNITVIAQFIKKYGFFPVAGRAAGLRQPVHVSDLVNVVASIINQPITFGKIYSLAGAEKLSYKSMLERIFSAFEKPVRILRLPIWLYRLLLSVRSADYSKGTADRMNHHLDYDIRDAQADFDYDPQTFLAMPQRDLP